MVLVLIALQCKPESSLLEIAKLIFIVLDKLSLTLNRYFEFFWRQIFVSFRAAHIPIGQVMEPMLVGAAKADHKEMDTE